MKKLFTLLVSCLLFVVNLTAQTLPVFNYTYPKLSEIKKLASEYSEKGHAFYVYLEETINMKLADTTFRVSDAQQLGVDSMFKYLSLSTEEIHFKDGSWLNSGYDPSKGEMVPSIGHDWIGFCWMFKIGSYSFPILKADCSNTIRSIGFYASKYSPLDILAFKKKLEDISNNYNLLSVKVDQNKSNVDKAFAELELRMKKMEDAQKSAIGELKSENDRFKLQLKEDEYRSKGWRQIGIGTGLLALSGVSYYLYKTPVYKPEQTETFYEKEYEYYKYDIEKIYSTPVGKSSKSGGLLGIANCDPEPPKPPVVNNYNYYELIDYIYNYITYNQINVTNIDVIQQYFQYFQTFVTNIEYTTNNYNEYITKIEEIFNTYNTYVTNNYTYVTNIINPDTYKLIATLMKGKITFSVIDKTMVAHDRANKNMFKTISIISAIAGIVLETTGITNLGKAHQIHLSLKQDLKQSFTGQNQNYSNPLQNTQLAIRWTFRANNKNNAQFN